MEQFGVNVSMSPDRRALLATHLGLRFYGDLFLKPHHCRLKSLGVLVQVVHMFKHDTLFLEAILRAFARAVKEPDVFLRAIEVEPANRLAVVVVEQNAAVALHVAHHDPFDRNDFAQDCPDDVEAFEFFLGRHDSILAAIRWRAVRWRT